MATCKGKGCTKEVTKPGHFMCYDCWKAQNGGKSSGGKSAAKPVKLSNDESLSARSIAEHFTEKTGSKITAQKMNGILNELGWINKPPYGKQGWDVTKAGRRKGAFTTPSKDGTPYVRYPMTVVNDRALRKAVSDMVGDNIAPEVATQAQETAHVAPRKTHTIKTRDGHYVRSRGEALIDNFLYAVRIAHAYEQEVILSENVTMVPDFVALTPSGNVYIEFWGMEGQPDYDARKQDKINLYKEYELTLVEVSPQDLDNLDAYLSRKLAPFGVQTAF